MSEVLVDIRVETLNDGRKALVADVAGAGRVLFGYLMDRDTHLQIGARDFVARGVKPVD